MAIQDNAPDNTLEAPLTLAADQLERVAGGMSLSTIGVHGPINGLFPYINVLQVAAVAKVSAM